MLHMTQHKIYWIGGSPCSGKSSIAEKLASEYDLTYYRCDDAMDRHFARCRPDRHPVMHKLKSMNSGQLFSRPVQEQVEDELAFYREEFAMILEDIRELPAGRPVLAEGAALLPEKVCAVLEAPHLGVWIVPEKEFQLAQYSQRSWVGDVLKDCRDPEEAFANWMERDIRFAKIVAGQAAAYSFKLITVDGSSDLTANIATVKEHFRLDTFGTEQS
ncbi:hypothetical protein [Gorillibacterium massiliense]|uniref:hypothetical protein n=1 Tax=Gorillibacterium massiliense TaxID=1280390 RepID=UPI0004AD1C25|nr:hypothetical protein [Gorillibacterium massiliense]